MNKTKRTWLGILAAAFAALVLAASLVLALPVFARSADAAIGAQTENSVAKISKSGTHYYDSLQKAIDAAEGYAASSSPTITLLKDVTLTEQVTLDVSQIAEGRYIKINGDGCTLSTSSVEQPFRIVGGTGVKADVEVRISDLTMKSTVPQAKLLSVEGGAFTLVLDAVTLDTTGSAQNDRALSVGWNSTAGGTVGIEMTDSTIRTSASGYAVMTYNPVALNIESSTLCGYAALYMYNDVYKNGTGSATSVVTINGSVITSDNVYNTGSQSDFAAFVFKDNDIKVDIFNSDITANANGTSLHGVVLFDASTGSSVYTESTSVTVTGDTVHYIITNEGGSGTLRFGAGTRSNVPFDFDHDDILVSGCTPLQDGAGYVVSATDPAATCGNIGCISLQNAIDTAQEGQAVTIVLKKDVAENVTIPAGKEIVLDLNGHSLTAESGTAITNNGTLTIKDDTAAGSGEGYIAGTVSAASTVSATSKAVYSTGPLTIENGIFCGGYAVDTKCASVNISGGVFKGGSSPAVQFNKSGGSLTIAGGSFTSESTGSGAVYVSAADSVTIKDAAITGSTYGFYSKAKEATIGGNTTIDATNIGAKNLAAIYAIGTKLTLKDNVVIEQLIRLANGTTARIESGTYHAKLTNIATSGAVSTGEFCIVGGIFVSEDITAWFDPAWLIDGEVRYALYSEQDTGEYVVNQYHENDTNAVFIGGYVAQVDGMKYEDLAAALSAANGKTLKLLTNVTDPLTIEATMTLDLGIFGVGTDATTLTVNSGAILTIEGDGHVYGSIENNGNIVLRGGTYNAAEIKIDWVDADRAIAYDSGDELYTVSGDVGVTLTRGGKAYHFSNLYTPFNAGIIQTGETLVLQKDVVGGITLGESRQGHAYTIDMNGHNIEGSFMLIAGTLNIVNNGVARANATLSNTQRIFQILPSANCGATLTLGQNIDLVSGEEAVFIQTPIMTEDITDLDTLQPVAILHSSANILSQNSFAIVANGTGHGTEIVIDGGSVKTEGDAPAIYHPQYGALTVKGGAVVEGATGIEIRNGILRVEDATIRSTADAFEVVETPNKGGSTVTGAAIAVTKYNNAKVPLKVTIGEATLQASKEGKALYEGYPDSTEGTLPSGNTVEMKIDGATIEAPVESKNVTEFIKSGTFKTQDGTPIDVTEYLVDGMAQNTSGTVVPEAEKDAVAMIGNTYYDTLQDAVNAVPANADAPTMIVLVGGNADQTITGNGVIVQSGQNIIIDFNGKTYDINNNTVGSSGTETNGFQLLGGSTVVMKNGVIRSDHAKILLQNYCALTLEDMKLSSTVTGCYIVSNNFGSMTVTGDTEIIADSTKGQVAFDVYFGMSANYYGGIEINFTEDFTGKVEGAIEYGRAASASGVADWQEKASLSIAADDTAVFDVSFEMETGANEENANINIESGTFKKVFAPAFLAKDTALYMNGDKTSFAVAPANETPAGMQKVVAMIDDQVYASLQDAITAAKDDDTVTLLADIVLTETVTIEKDLTLDLGSWTLTAPQNAAALVIEAGDATIKGAAVQGKSSARAQIVGGAQADRVIVIKTNGTAAIESVSIQLNTTVNKIDEVAVLAAAVEINGAKSVVLNGVVVEMNVVAASGDSSNNVEGILIVNTGEVEIKESVLRVSLTTAASIANAQLQLHGIHAEQTHLTVDTVDITTRCSGRCQDTGIVFYGAMTQDQATAESASEQYKVLNVINCNIDACIIGISGNGGGTNHGTIMNIVDTKVDYSDRPNGAGVIGTGIYHPQYGILNVSGNDTYIIGGAGIEIRSGELNLAGGTVVGTDPLGHWSGDSGNTVGGAAVAVSQHTTELPITVSITGGTLEATGENGRSVYELDTVESDEPSKGVALLLTGGTYNAPVESDNLTQFIEGGRFKTLPAAKYCSEDFAPVYSNGYFDVIPSTALKEAKADAQADVRAYAAVLGLDWSDIQDAAADEAHADHDLASAVMAQYDAIAEAADTLAVKTIRATALEKVEEYASALEAAFEDYKKDKIKGEELAAALAGEEGEADDVVLSTSVIAALYEAPTKELFDLYYENVLEEIADIRAFREEIARQTAALKVLDDALEALDGALLGADGALGTLQSEIKNAIAAAQNAITGATADGTGGMSLKDVHDELNKTIGKIRSEVAQALSSLQSDLTAVKNGMLNNADLEKLLSDIQTKLDTAVTAITGGDGNSIANAVNSIETAFTTLQTTLVGKIEAVKTQADTLLTLFAKDSDGYYTMKELAATLATLATPEDLTSIQTTLTAITDAQEKMEDAIAGVKTELTAQTDAIDSALTALTGKVDTLTGSLAAVNSGLTEKIDALQASATALSTALSALASKTDVAAVAADLKAAAEQLNAVKASVDSIAVQVSAAAAVEEAKTEGAAEIEAWLNAYLDEILGNETAGLVRASAYTAETTEGELYARLVESFGEDNAGLVLKYYNEALAAIDAAESVSDVTSAVSTFKAQVASVEAAAGNAPSFTVTYILLAAVLVVALVALLVLLLKRSPAPAPAPASAPASEPASESPAPAAEETAAAEAPSEAEGDVIVLPELEEDQEHVVIAATTRTFDEAYEALDETARSLFDRVKAYALTKEDAAESMQSSGVCVKRGGKLIVKLTVRRGNPVALFRIENDLVKDFRRNAESPVKLKVRATELVLHEEGDLEAAYAMVDLAVEQIERDIENAKERRREARRARRLQNQAAAQTDETDKTDKED